MVAPMLRAESIVSFLDPRQNQGQRPQRHWDGDLVLGEIIGAVPGNERGHSSIGKKSYAKVQRGGVAENPVMEMPSKPGDFGLFRPASRHGGIL